jgi:uncharacterized protein
MPRAASATRVGEDGAVTLALVALLLVVLGVLVWRALTREQREYARFRRLRSTGARQKVYRRWLVEAALLMGGLSVAVLLAAWPFVPQALRSARDAPALGAVVDWAGGPVGQIVLPVAGALVVAALVLPVLLLRGTIDEVPTLGNVGPLLPRTRAEVGWGAALGVNAGVVEELLFRLALPALLFGIVGDGLAAFLLAAVVFGFLHLYQGLVGVLVTTVLGLVFTLVYVVTGSILWPILLHAAIDLRAFVLIPVALQGVWQVRGEAPRAPSASGQGSAPGSSRQEAAS